MAAGAATPPERGDYLITRRLLMQPGGRGMNRGRPSIESPVIASTVARYPKRSGAPGSVARGRVLALVAPVALVATASVGAAQTGFAPPLAGSFPSSIGVTATVPSARATTLRFGLSESVRVIVAAPASRIDPGELAAAGMVLTYGHRWTRDGAPPPAAPAGPRVLGVATRPSIEAVEAIGPLVPLVPPGNEVVVPREPGVWTLEDAAGNAVTVIAVVPATETRGGRLNGYHIGTYPTAGSGRTDAYAPPAGFIEVLPETVGLPVSRHLTVGQFITKDQFNVWPKYVALDMRLIDKLELVVRELNDMGIRADRVHIMSGFRTPQYNGPGGGGRASLSRHMWGDAADMWIDNDGDGLMDDLNGDGEINLTDAAVIMRAVDRVEARFPELIGGAGLYPTTSTHGPYIHIDARGHHSRW